MAEKKYIKVKSEFDYPLTLRDFLTFSLWGFSVMLVGLGTIILLLKYWLWIVFLIFGIVFQIFGWIINFSPKYKFKEVKNGR